MRSGKVRRPTAAAERPSGGPAHMLSSLTGLLKKDAVPTSSTAIEQPAGETAAQPTAMAVEPVRWSTRLASSAAQMPSPTEAGAAGLKPQKAKKAAGAVPVTGSASKRGTARTAAISDSGAAATPASKARKGVKSSPAPVLDSAPRNREPAGGHAEEPALIPPVLRSSAHAAVKSTSASGPKQAAAKRSRPSTCNLKQSATHLKAAPDSAPANVLASAPEAPRSSVRSAAESPSASAPEQAPAKRSRRSATAPKQAAPPAQALTQSTPPSLPASASHSLERSARAAARAGSASAHERAPAGHARSSATTPKQAPTEHTRCSAAASEQATPAPEAVPDSVPAQAKRSKRTAGKAAEDSVQDPTPAGQCGAANAPILATVTPEAPAKRGTRSAAELEESVPAAQPVPDSVPARRQLSRRIAGEAAAVHMQTATPPVKSSRAAATLQAAKTPEAVPDSVPARDQRSRRRASKAAEHFSLHSVTPPVKCSMAIATQAAAMVETNTESSPQVVAAESDQHEVPTSAPAPDEQPAWAASKPQPADARAHAEASGAAASSLPVAAEASSAPAHSPAPEQERKPGCSKCRHAPKGCKKCRAQLEKAMQRQAGAGTAQANEKLAPQVAQLQRENAERAAPEPEQCANQPELETTQVSRVTVS